MTWYLIKQKVSCGA